MNAKVTLSHADEARLRSLIANHQRACSQIPMNHRAQVDRLAQSVKKRLFASPLPPDVLSWTTQVLSRSIRDLTPMEAKSLAVYAVHRVAASGGDGALALGRTAAQMIETQMSFNLQYLQLQSQMQHENQAYTAVSNLMKSKADSVTNSINNIR